VYKPLPNSVTIKESLIHGLGLYATERILQGTLIGITHHVQVHSENGVIRTPLGGFGNHSDTPNCFKLLIEETTWWIGAKIDIEKGEELTWQYTLYNLKT
jgi:SET domain-containing protein